MSEWLHSLPLPWMALVIFSQISVSPEPLLQIMPEKADKQQAAAPNNR